MEYITKKVPKRTAEVIRRLVSRLSLRHKRRVTESEVIALGMARLEEETEKVKRKTLASLSGIIEGGGRSDETDIDTLLYS